MNKKITALLLVTLLFSPNLFSWGHRVHNEATWNVCRTLLPHFGSNFENYMKYIADNGSLPDKWKFYDSNESPNHYCDYDFYAERDLIDLNNPFEKVLRYYGSDFMKKNGTVIWAIEEYYKLLVDAFENQDFSSALVYMSALSHYIQDIHQPFHTTKNYDGQLTGNKGIHARYEIDMIDHFWVPEDIKEISPDQIPQPAEIKKFVINIIEESLTFVPEILSADRAAREDSDGSYDHAYFEALWEDTGGMTAQRIYRSQMKTSALLLSAWKAAGSPAFPQKVLLLEGRMQGLEKPQFFKEGRVKRGEISEKKIVFSGALAAVIFIGIIAALKGL